MHGGNINYSFPKEISRLFIIVKSNNYILLKALLRNGADVKCFNKQHQNLLHVAMKFTFKENEWMYPDAKHYKFAIIRLLIKYGVSLDCKDKKGKTPLDYVPPKYINKINSIIKEASNSGDERNAINTVKKIVSTVKKENTEEIPLEETALNELIDKESQTHDPEIQNALGEKYLHGLGVEENYDLAYKYFKLAAEQGNIEAEYKLGILFFSNEVLHPNTELMFKYLYDAAENGYHLAKEYLGDLYLNGVGTKQDLASAFTCYKSIANSDYENASSAMVKLAKCYLCGSGTKTNNKEAVLWLKKASALEDPDAQELLASCYESGVIVDQDYEKALGLFKKSAENGYKFLFTKVAKYYCYGYGTPVSFQNAVEWFTKAAACNDKDAIKWLEENNVDYKHFYPA